MSQAMTILTTKRVFNLDTFETEVVGRESAFTPAGSMQEVLERIGGSNEVLLQMLNDALIEKERETLRNAEGEWRTFKEGSQTDLNGVFEGTIVDESSVYDLRNTLSRSMFGYDPKDPKEVKQAKKQKAMDFIKNTPAVRDGLVNALKG